MGYLVTSLQPTADGVLGHTTFLVDWTDGRRFMIDAGMDRPTAEEFARLIQWSLDGGELELRGDVAEQLGADASRVAGVGFTHLHIDHAQGLVPFCRVRGPGARLVQTRWQAEEHNLHTSEGAGIVSDSCLSAASPSMDTIGIHPDFPGLGLVALGGHTPGSTLFAVAIEHHLWLFSGDITNRRAELVEDRGKGFVYSYLMVPEHTRRTAELRAWLRALDAEADMTVVVSHDFDALGASGLAPIRAGASRVAQAP